MVSNWAPERGLRRQTTQRVQEPVGGGVDQQAGHRRDAHSTSLRSDGVDPVLLGMTKGVSEAVRRALARIEETAGLAWLERRTWTMASGRS
jgi:hypothetical protein